MFEPDSTIKEMTVVSIHPGVTREQIQRNTGWAVKYAANIKATPAPTETELDVLRQRQAKTKAAHGGQ